LLTIILKNYSFCSQGALGFSTGLAYPNAIASDLDELQPIVNVLSEFEGSIYATHLRSETSSIMSALDEAFLLASNAKVSLVISHLKCATKPCWGLSGSVLDKIDSQSSRLVENKRQIGFDCYPYSASSSLLDLKQVTTDYAIDITWSETYPYMAGRTLAQIGKEWQLRDDLTEVAKRLQPAGAIYHCMDEIDVERIMSHPLAAIGSDGLPCDPLPHPRLFGTFARVLGKYVREKKLLTLTEAVHKMSGLSARRFGLRERGLICCGYFADLVLFDAERVQDRATFAKPKEVSAGIVGVWVNGRFAYRGSREVAVVDDDDDFEALRESRAGRFLERN
jgi:N-acyl-D-amino-acid deacylase